MDSKQVNELVKFAKMYKELYDSCEGQPTFYPDSNLVDGFVEMPQVQLNSKTFIELARFLDVKPTKGYYYSGSWQYYFVHDGVNFMCLREESKSDEL